MRTPASRPFHALSIDWMQATGRPDGADGESARAGPTAASYAQFTRKTSMSCLPLCTGFVYPCKAISRAREPNIGGGGGAGHERAEWAD
jgi:hypothetical protein